MIENKLARSVGILSLFSVSPSTLNLLYFALLQPHLFGVVLWGSTCSSYLSNCNRRIFITTYCHKLGILKIAKLYKFEIAKIMHQQSNQVLPLEYQNLFKPLSGVHNRTTKSVSMNHFHVEKFSTVRCQRSINFQGAKIWNSITLKLRGQPLKKFKINYKEVLLERYPIS